MRTLMVLFVLFLASGCGTATIYLKDGSSLEARIKRGDASSIYVLPVKKCEKRKKYETTKTCYDEEIAVSRSDIKDIDHPGNYTAAVGGVIGALGLGVTFLLWSGHQNCTDECFESGIVTGAIASPFLIIGSIGAVIGIGGLVSYAWSRKAAEPPKEKKTTPRVSPVAMTDGEKTYYGIGMSWSW